MVMCLFLELGESISKLLVEQTSEKLEENSFTFEVVAFLGIHVHNTAESSAVLGDSYRGGV